MEKSRTFVCTSNGSRNGKTLNLVCTAVDADHQLAQGRRPQRKKSPSRDRKSKSLSSSSSEDCDCKCEIKEPVIYVRAPVIRGDERIHRRCEGSRRDPYPTLQEAQADRKWCTLVVLYSPTPLNGGITLQDDQNLIGDPSGLQPVITNSGPQSNGGNGAVLLGDNCVKNIHFKDTWSSAINYDNAKDVCIKDVLITGHNRGGVVSTYLFPRPVGGLFLPIEIAAIEGHNRRNGKTIVENTVIRNNHTGPGINNFPYDGGDRKLVVKDTEIYELTTIVLTSTTIIRRTAGIFSGPFDYKSSSKDEFENLYIHDFRPHTTAGSTGIHLIPASGGRQSGKITLCRFDNLFTGAGNTIHIFGSPVTDLAQIPSGGNNNYNNLREKSNLEFHVSDCSFEEPVQYTARQITAVQTSSFNGDAKWSVQNSTIQNLFDIFVTFVEGDCKTEVALIENTAYGLEAFYAAASVGVGVLFPTVPNARRIVKAFLKDNTYVGGDALGAVGVVSSANAINAPFDKLEIDLKDNCFDGKGTGAAGVFGLDLGTAGAGNVIIKGCHNNIVGYLIDVLDQGTNITYDLDRNYWGPGRKCDLTRSHSSSRSSSHSSSNSSSDYSRDICAPTQICKHGECTGADVIITTGPARVDVSNPLDHPVKCADDRGGKFDIELRGSHSSFSPGSSSCSKSSSSSSCSKSRSRRQAHAYQELTIGKSGKTSESGQPIFQLPDPNTLSDEELNEALAQFLDDVADRFQNREV